MKQSPDQGATSTHNSSAHIFRAFNVFFVIPMAMIVAQLLLRKVIKGPQEMTIHIPISIAISGISSFISALLLYNKPARSDPWNAYLVMLSCLLCLWILGDAIEKPLPIEKDNFMLVRCICFYGLSLVGTFRRWANQLPDKVPEGLTSRA